MGVICIFGKQRVGKFEIGAITHLVNDNLAGLLHSGHCDHQDWFMSRHKCWMPMKWCCLYLQQVAGYRIQSLEWIPLPLFTYNAREVVVLQNHPLLKGIPLSNGLWQPHHNCLSHQFAKHYCCNRGESLSKTHSIRHQCYWNISIPNPSPHNEPECPNLVRQKPCSGQAWNWIFASSNTVHCWLANRMGIQQPDCVCKWLMFISVADCIANSAQYWNGITWIEHLLAIHLLLNISWTLIGFLFLFNDLFSCSEASWPDGLILQCLWN